MPPSVGIWAAIRKSTLAICVSGVDERFMAAQISTLSFRLLTTTLSLESASLRSATVDGLAAHDCPYDFGIACLLSCHRQNIAVQ